MGNDPVLTWVIGNPCVDASISVTTRNVRSLDSREAAFWLAIAADQSPFSEYPS